MQVREAMSDDVQIASPNQTIREAATLMAKIDAGILPVGDNDRLVGMISDRDIAVRAIALGKGPDTPVREVMSGDVKYCFEEDDVDDVAQNMADIKVRRLPVLNKSKRLVGIVSLGDLALTDGPDNAGEALCSISKPGSAHSQSADGRPRGRADAPRASWTDARATADSGLARAFFFMSILKSLDASLRLSSSRRKFF